MPEDHPLRVETLRQFDDLMVDDGERFFFQPCFSPVWDTAIGAYALAQSEPKSTAVRRAADWLLAREVRRKGDWSVKRPETEPSGWAFEYNNEFYPDIDDTAMVMLALSEAAGSNPAAQKACHERAVHWLLDMQSSDGGWAAFDADNNWEFPEPGSLRRPQRHARPHLRRYHRPRAGSAGGRTVWTSEHPRGAARRGVAGASNQEPDGSWYGRWGVAYIYGTCFALRGLAASGESDREAHMLRAGEWLRSIQNADGGWGESCASYDNGSLHRRPEHAFADRLGDAGPDRRRRRRTA